MTILSPYRQWLAEVEQLANRFDPTHQPTGYLCDLCHDAGYIETGGDQTEPCPLCAENWR